MARKRTSTSKDASSVTAKGRSRSMVRRKAKTQTESVAITPRWGALCGVHVKNFKKFSELEPVALSPLTFLTGPNSAGKSTIIQSLVLLKQSLESTSASGEILFDDLINLGSLENVLCDTAGTSIETLSLGVDIATEKVGDLASEDVGFEVSGGRIVFEIGNCGDQDSGKQRPVLLSLRVGVLDSKKVFKECFVFTRNQPANTSDQRRNENQYKLQIVLPKLKRTRNAELKEKLAAGLSDDLIVSLRGGLMARSKGVFPEEAILSAKKRKSSEAKDTRPRVLVMPLAFISPLLEYLMSRAKEALTSRLSYIGPLRVEPQFLYTQTPRSIGVRGENSLAYLRAHAEQTVKKGMPDRTDCNLSKCVNAWLREMGVSKGLVFHKRGGMFFEPLAGKRSLPELGCGVGQILPVLVQCLVAEPGATVLLEQPEIHLHQALQGNLCDFFLAQVQRGIKLVVETHSEIMIQRLRRRIAEAPGDKINKNAAVLFVDGKSDNVTTMEIDEDGNVANWPESFFDQSIVEMQALAEAQRHASEEH